jgi:hypothetical protein
MVKNCCKENLEEKTQSPLLKNCDAENAIFLLFGRAKHCSILVNGQAH